MATAQSSDLSSFFKKKKDKKKKTIVKDGVNDVDSPRTARKVVAEDGWIDNVDQKRAVIKTSGKTVADLENLNLSDNENEEDKAQREEARKAFHWARSQVKKKTKDGEEEKPAEAPAVEAPKLGWRDRERIKQEKAAKIQLDSDRQFPTLSGIPTRQETLEPAKIKTQNIWSTFTENDSDHEEEQAADQEVEASTPVTVDETRKSDSHSAADENTAPADEKKLAVEESPAAAQSAEAPEVQDTEGGENSIDRFAGLKKKKKKKKVPTAEELAAIAAAQGQEE